MDSTVTTQEQPPATEKASRWEDFIDVFISPAELFRRRANDSWTIPVIVLAVASLVVYFGFMSVNRAFMNATMAQAVAENPQAAAGMERMVGMQSTIGGIFLPIGMVIGVMIAALFIWFACKIMSIELRYRQALTISAFVGFLMVLQMLVVSIVAMFKVNRGEALDPISDRSTGILYFMEPAEMNAAVIALLSRVDVFAIWTAIITAIALIAVTNAPRNRAYVAAALVWFIGAVPMLIPAMMK